MVNICTTIEQSKHLLELGLNPETADMYIFNLVAPNGKIDGTNVRYIFKEELNPFVNVEPENIIPSWSLSAMLELMPECINKNGIGYVLYLYKVGKFYGMCYEEEDRKAPILKSSLGDTAVSAAYILLCWLLENHYIKTDKQ